MNHQLLTRLEKAEDQRKAARLNRELHLVPQNNFINLASNDYLSLSRHNKVIKAGQVALENYGSSTSGSPVVNGYLPIHKELENSLSEWIGIPECLLWTSGSVANHNIMKLIPQKGDIVFADELIHFSLIKGILQSKARLIRYKHSDLEHLEHLLKKFKNDDRVKFVVTESLFSMDGDYPDLQHMASLKENYRFFWIVDEAHAIGWYGPNGNGLAAQYEVADKIDILIATLGKSLASQGAFSLFHSKKIKEYLVNSSKDFIYSTYLAPSLTATANAAIQVIKNDLSSKLNSLRQKAKTFHEELKTIFPQVINRDGPIVPIILGEEDAVLSMAKSLLNDGILVGAIRPPSVPKGTARLRLSLNREFLK